MRKASGGLLVVLGAAAILFVPSSPPAISASSQDAVRLQKPLQHEVTVTVKLIQVYVTDKKGKPVQDLTKEDFVVRDNGREMSLTEFEKHALPPARSAAQPPAAPEKRETLVETAMPPPTPMNRKFFLFFDFANNYAKGIVKAKEAALHFLNAELIPGDQVGLMSYSMFKGLAIHEFLTSDLKKIAEAVGDLSVKENAGRVEDFEGEYWGKATMINATPYAKSRFQLEMERKESKYQVQNFIVKLTDLAKALRYVPGKKHFVLFSTGVVTSLIYYGQAGQPTGGMAAMANKVDAGDFALRTLYEDMLKEMTASDCSIFSFDTREAAMVSALFDSDKQSLEDGQRNITSVEGAREPQNVFREDKTTGFYTMSRLSSATGGKYFSNIEDYKKSLGELQTLTGSYYVLGYPISQQWGGQFHEIKVEVKRKGCEVRAQSGYFDPKPFAEYSDLEKQLHLFDLALSDQPMLQTPLAFPMTGLAYYADGGQRLQMMSKIPVSVMDRFAGRKVELVAVAFDEKENVAGFDRSEIDLTKYRGMDVFWASGSVLRSGSYKCRLVIRDLDNGTGAVASLRTTIPSTSFTSLGLHSALLLAPGSDFVYLESPQKAEGGEDWRKYYPYDRAGYHPILNELAVGTAKLYVLAPCSYPGRMPPEISLAAWLIDGTTGEKIPLAGSILSRTPNPAGDSILAELSTGDVKPGTYRLYLHVTAMASQAVAYAQVPLRIK